MYTSPVTISSQPGPDDFVLAATEQRRAAAEAILSANPAIERDAWAALVLGRGWDGDPNEPGGPRGWAPLLYVTHSCFAAVEPARELLDRGADPNAFFTNEYGRMSALYGAAGRVHDPDLTRLLLERGASPDDGESLYHATEAPSPDCVRVLLEHGASVEGTNALAHALDEDRIEHVRLLLEAGADITDGAYVAHAVRRGRGPDVLRLLVERGADVNRPGGETWRGDVPLRTPYQHAALRARDDVAEALARLGAATDVDPADVAVGSVARGRRPDSPLPAEPDVDAQEVLILTALFEHPELVVDLVGPDFRGVVGGSPEGGLLHHAAWVGNARLVRELLRRGADPNVECGGGSPLAWAAHGSQNWQLADRDYVAVAEQLVDAGNRLDDRLLQEADGPLYVWIADRVREDA
jgi:ankyrin repeat protein